jgi:Phorbol esters/diacylglycerol binding domain (C1 domain)
LSLASTAVATRAFAKFGVEKAGPPIHVNALPPPAPLIVPSLDDPLVLPPVVPTNPAPQPVLHGNQKKHNIVRMKGKLGRFRTCAVCESKLVGIFHSAHRCSDCRVVAHGKCVTLFQLATDCQGNGIQIPWRND